MKATTLVGMSDALRWVLAGVALAIGAINAKDFLARGEGFSLQASGGVRDAADIVAVREAGCAGAVLGKALLEGRMTVEEALTC